jgi:hypothetical protein
MEAGISILALANTGAILGAACPMKFTTAAE